MRWRDRWAVSTAFALALLALGCAEAAPVEGTRCSAERVCPKGYGCVGGECRALPEGLTVRCGPGNPCPVGVCLRDAGFCVQCTDDEHCPNSSCLPDALVCGCSERDHCRTRRCNTALQLCVGCLSDAQCPGGRCDLETNACIFFDDAPTGPERKVGPDANP